MYTIFKQVEQIILLWLSVKIFVKCVNSVFDKMDVHQKKQNNCNLQILIPYAHKIKCIATHGPEERVLYFLN